MYYIKLDLFKYVKSRPIESVDVDNLEHYYTKYVMYKCFH